MSDSKSRTTPLTVEMMVPGGILPTDHWHRNSDDGTCSRCRAQTLDDQVPLLIWSSGGHDMLRYCEPCLGIAAHYGEDDEYV